jgi:hypothetical protein
MSEEGGDDDDDDRSDNSGSGDSNPGEGTSNFDAPSSDTAGSQDAGSENALGGRDYADQLGEMADRFQEWSEQNLFDKATGGNENFESNQFQLGSSNDNLSLQLGSSNDNLSPQWTPHELSFDERLESFSVDPQVAPPQSDAEQYGEQTWSFYKSETTLAVGGGELSPTIGLPPEIQYTNSGNTLTFGYESSQPTGPLGPNSMFDGPQYRLSFRRDF